MRAAGANANAIFLHRETLVALFKKNTPNDVDMPQWVTRLHMAKAINNPEAVQKALDEQGVSEAVQKALDEQGDFRGKPRSPLQKVKQRVAHVLGRRVHRSIESDEEGQDEEEEKQGGPQRSSSGLLIESEQSKQKSKQTRWHTRWGLDEVQALIEGVSRCGVGNWSRIKELGVPELDHRTNIDLKDKWRNLLRIATLPTPSGRETTSKSGGDKKREIPRAMLDRVRELAMQHAKNKERELAAKAAQAQAQQRG